MQTCSLAGVLAPLVVLSSVVPPALAQDGTGSIRAVTRIATLEGGFEVELESRAWFGTAAAFLGDVDADGIDDLFVGSNGDTDGNLRAGAGYVLFMRSDGTVRSHQKISATEGNGPPELGELAYFGSAAAPLGDLDGDGVPDVAVGMPNNFVAQGSVWILFLNADGSVKTRVEISQDKGGFQGPLAGGDQFGGGLASLGDLNGDGRIELAVGAPSDAVQPEFRGAVWILSLSEHGVVQAETKLSAADLGTPNGQSCCTSFGDALTPLGDVNGDGFTDLAIGARNDSDGGGFATGAVWIYFLDATGSALGRQKISATAGGFTGALNGFDAFGSAVAGLGDVDGDGSGDLLVGASGDKDHVDGPGGNVGAAWILYLRPDGTVRYQEKHGGAIGGLSGLLPQFNSSLGSAASRTADLDGDGRPEVVVGAFADSAGEYQSGAVYVLELANSLDPVFAPIGCGVNPPGSLTVAAGEPIVGTTIRLAVDNPLGTQAPGALTLLALSRLAAPGFPCGPQLPGFGMAGAGAPGELLVGSFAAPSGMLVTGPFWIGAPIGVELELPSLPVLLGTSLVVQALLVDPSPSSSVPLGLTGGMLLRVAG